MWLPKSATIEKIHEYILARMGGEKGPLNPTHLDAAIRHAKTFVYGHEPYKTAVAKVAALGWGIISWHPFLDGNKRTAIFAMIATLDANGFEMFVPPYIVKYSVQAALPPENNRHIEEPVFISRISSLCSRQDSRLRRWKEFRFETYPNWILQRYRFMVNRSPKSKFYNRTFGRMIFDWFAAEDPATMAKTLLEWQLRAEQGYPREVPEPDITIADFEEVGEPEALGV